MAFQCVGSSSYCTFLLITACGVQKIMWKLNKAIARDMLPSVPVDFLIEPWWTVSIVNLTIEEFRVSLKDSLMLDIFCTSLREGFGRNRDKTSARLDAWMRHFPGSRDSGLGCS